MKRMTVMPNTRSSRALDCNKWGFLMMMVSLHEHHDGQLEKTTWRLSVSRDRGGPTPLRSAQAWLCRRGALAQHLTPEPVRHISRNGGIQPKPYNIRAYKIKQSEPFCQATLSVARR